MAKNPALKRPKYDNSKQNDHKPQPCYRCPEMVTISDWIMGNFKWDNGKLRHAICNPKYWKDEEK